MRGRKIYIAVSWIPLASLMALLRYLKKYDGWGSWGAAPLFLPVIGISAVMEIIGIVLFISKWRNSRPDFILLAAILLSGSVAIYYVFKGFQ